MANTVDRTYVCSIRNGSQVSGPLDFAGFAAAKFWNVARWTAGRIWDETGRIPGASELQSYLQGHERYKDLHSHTAQRVLQELDEAFNGWYGHRGNGSETANPPGYRKNGDDHPRSTVTWKRKGFDFDDEHGYVRLSKGPNAKEYWSDFILCAIDAPPTMPDADRLDVRQVRAVFDDGRGEWELHLVCKVETETPDAPGDGTAGVDLGICNIAAVSFGDDVMLFPGGWLKEAKHYYKRIEYECEGENGLSDRARRAKRKLRRKREHFQHVLSKRIVEECVGRGVGSLYVGDLGGIRDEEDGDGRDWGRHGNKRLHGWAFGKLTSMLEYKAEAEGIDVTVDDERGTSKTCCVCGREDGSQRVERGLYKCDKCGFVGNADANGAENIRTLLPSPERHARRDRDNGRLARPETHLFDDTAGRFRPRERVRREP